MTNKQKIEYIRKKCVEANKSILDLSLGTELTCKGKTLQYVGKDNVHNAHQNYQQNQFIAI